MNESVLTSKLKNNIWTTRKCRIIASERLLSNAKYIEILNVVYSISIILVSLFSYIKKDEGLSLFGIVLSISLTISIVFANATGYRNRSASLKNNYIELMRLLNKLENNDSTIDADDASEEYAELLKASENHLPIDLYRMKIENPDTDSPIKPFDRLKWYWHLIWTTILKAILLLTPLAILILRLTGVI